MRHAIIKLPKKRPESITTPFVQEIHAEEQWIKEFKEQCFQLSEFVKPRLEAEDEIKQRWLNIEEKAKEPEVIEPESYDHYRE